MKASALSDTQTAQISDENVNMKHGMPLKRAAALRTCLLRKCLVKKQHLRIIKGSNSGSITNHPHPSSVVVKAVKMLMKTM